MFDVLYSIVVFLLFAGLFHVLLYTRWRNKGDRFWRATDYCWLAVALLGLWGVSEQYEKTLLSQRIHDAQVKLEQEYAAQQVRVASLMAMQIEFALDRLAREPSGAAKDRDWLRTLVNSHARLNVLQQAMTFKRPHKPHALEIQKIVSTSGEGLHTEFSVDGAAKMLARSIRLEDELERLRSEANSVRYSVNWRLLAPLLLALALALRFTRVTAEVFVNGPVRPQ